MKRHKDIFCVLPHFQGVCNQLTMIQPGPWCRPPAGAGENPCLQLPGTGSPQAGHLACRSLTNPLSEGSCGAQGHTIPYSGGEFTSRDQSTKASKAWLLPWVSSIPEELSQLQSSSRIGPGQGSYGTAAQPPPPPNPASLPPSQVLFLAC